MDVYETLNAGGVSKILYRNEPNDPWTVLYSADEIIAVPEPTILSVPVEVMAP